MSQENVEIVRRLVDAWNRQDLEALLAFADPDAEYVNAPSAVEPGTRRGHEGLASVARAQCDIPGALIELDRVHDRGDEVITEGHVSLLMPGSDTRINNPFLSSWKFRDGSSCGLSSWARVRSLPKLSKPAGLSE